MLLIPELLFHQTSLPHIQSSSEVEHEFSEFVSEEQVKAFQKLCEEERLNAEKTQKLLDRYVSTGRLPRDYDLSSVLQNQPSILQRETILEKLKARVVSFIETFIDGI